MQADLETILFSIMRSKGFDDQYIDCYKMVTQFYQSRQPLVIIICGTACTGTCRTWRHCFEHSNWGPGLLGFMGMWAYRRMLPAGKSTIAQQLASRINIPNVMQTDIIYQVRPAPSHQQQGTSIPKQRPPPAPCITLTVRCI
jgi:hypothetical protein